MDKGLTVPKWVLIVRLKIPHALGRMYLPNLSVQDQKFWISMVFVVRVTAYSF